MPGPPERNQAAEGGFHEGQIVRIAGNVGRWRIERLAGRLASLVPAIQAKAGRALSWSPSTCWRPRIYRHDSLRTVQTSVALT